MNMPVAGRSRGNLTVGEIAAALPDATSVFRRYGLDFCCKGNVPLAESARLRGIDLAKSSGRWRRSTRLPSPRQHRTRPAR